MLLPIIKKEFLLVSRDVHAVAVLFLMPMMFIFIMSLSLQNTFEDKPEKVIKIGFIFDNPDDQLTETGKKLIDLPDIDIVLYPAKTVTKDAITNDELSTMIILPAGFIENLNKNQNKNYLLQLYYSPTAPKYVRKLVYSAISQNIVKIQIGKMLLNNRMGIDPDTLLKEQFNSKKVIQENELFNKKAKQPNSVEQTVPSWLIFSMFFVVIPISTTFIIEKQFGTLQRLKTMPVPSSYVLIGKLIPYLCINLVQTLLMFLVGIYLLPLVGGQGLTLNENAWLLLPMSFSVSILAISFALFIATLVKTTEQATTIGGLSNIIFAAIGGIMVPTFVMPQIMQSFARLSPMNWGLEGFLDIILREGDFNSIAPYMIKLSVAAIVFFSIALLLYHRTGNQK